LATNLNSKWNKTLKGLKKSLLRKPITKFSS